MNRLLFIILVFFVNTMNSQPWMQYLDKSNQSPSYYEIEKAFNRYLSDHPDDSQKSLKKYRRWEHFWANRINAEGHFPAKTYWEEAKKAGDKANRDFFSNWEELGPRTIPHNIPLGQPGGIGRIDCIAFHPTDTNTYWIGTPTGGLWKTYDDGENWENLTDQLPTLGVSDLKVHPNDENTLFLATGTRDTWWETFSVGILKSTDGGYNWSETGLSFDLLSGYQVNEILINPENPDIMLAATSNGIYRSTDGSDTWAHITYLWTKDIAFKPGDYSTVYAATFTPNGGGAKFYKSVDGGQFFDRVTNVGFNSSGVNRICIAVTEAAPDHIYLLCSSTQNNMYGFYKTTDAGETWSEPIADPLLNLIGYDVNGHDNGGFGFYMIGFAVSPENENELYAGGANIWKSTDGGVTWQNSADWLGRSGIDYVHADQHTLTYNLLSIALYSGCDGGIYKLEPGSDDWQDRSEGLGILQIYRIGLFYNDDNRALIGPQDNGIISVEEDALKELWLAEAGDNFYDQTDPDKIFVSGYGLGLCKSINGGYSISSIQPVGETKLVFNPPYIKHPIEDKIYCAYSDVYVSDNWGGYWNKIMDNPSSMPRMTSLEVAASDANVLYTSNGSNIWRTTNNGELWTNISSGISLYNAGISDITVSDQNPLHVWVTLGNYSNGNKVYSSIDGGDNWENISYNLPNIPTNCITYEPGSQSSVYVGTDVAVYYHNSDFNEWIYFSDGLPNVIVNELEINPEENKIKAGTFGRGIWESNLMGPVKVYETRANNLSFSVYPNPTSGSITVELNQKPETIIEVELLSMKGEIIWEHKNNQPEKTFHLQLPKIRDGNYILRINYNKQSNSQKINITDL